MTCIAGIADGMNVWLGADSAGSDESGTVFLHTEPKVWKRDGEMVMGVAGSRRIAQMLRYSLDCPVCPPDEGPLAFMATTFVESVQACLRHGGQTKTKDGAVGMDSELIVGLRGRLFTIDEEFGVNEAPEPYAAIGCGRAEAWGALYAMYKWWVPYVHPGGDGHHERILLDTALQCSERFNAAVRLPFAFISTTDK